MMRAKISPTPAGSTLFVAIDLGPEFRAMPLAERRRVVEARMAESMETVFTAIETERRIVVVQDADGHGTADAHGAAA